MKGPDGRPHVTPLICVWLDDSLHFCTGSTERKTMNLAQNPHCVLTTGCNQLDGPDLVVEGKVAKGSDAAELRMVADTFESKYGPRFTAPEGTWYGLGDAIRDGDALVYRVAPSTAFGFGKGKEFSQTRWRFHPTLLGADQRLFDASGNHVPLELVEARPLSTGVLFTTYKPESR